jgi:IclR family pca regulon transcriptional regulator
MSRTSALPVPAEIVEEVLDHVQAALVAHPVVDVLADREVEHPEPERREHHRAVGRDLHPAGHDVVEGAGEEVAVAGALDGKTFGLTPPVLQLGYSYLSSVPLREVARPHLEALTGAIGETAGLAILDGTEIVYVAIAMSPRLTSVRINLGTRLPAHATAAGQVLLAHLPPAELETYLERVDRASPAALREQLGRIRGSGFAVVDSELGEELRGVASPVPDGGSRVTAAVGVSLHSSRYSLDELASEVAPAVVDAAERIRSDVAGSGR